MDDVMKVSPTEARSCGDGGCVFRAPSDRGQHTNAGCRCLPLRMTPAERVGLRERIRSLVVELDGARTRLEGVGVVECLAARDAATRERERERANKAEQALAREKKNSAAREGLLTRRTDALRAAEREVDEARAERDRLRDVVEHAARTGSDATFRVAVCKGAGATEKLALVVTGPADQEENMARSVAGLICATMSLAMDERDVELRDAVAERDRLARILAVERGDEAQAPHGWVRHERWDDWLWGEVSVRPVGVRDRKSGARLARVWVAYGPGKKIGPQRNTALECMEAVIAEQEAADAAREVTHG